MSKIILLLILFFTVHSKFLTSTFVTGTAFKVGEKASHLISFNLDVGGPHETSAHLLGIFREDSDAEISYSSKIDFFGIDYEKVDSTKMDNVTESFEYKAERLTTIFKNTNVDFASHSTNMFISKKGVQINTYTQNLVRKLTKETKLVNNTLNKSDIFDGKYAATERLNYPYFLLNGENETHDFTFNFEECENFPSWIKHFVTPPQVRQNVMMLITPFAKAIHKYVMNKHGAIFFYSSLLNSKIEFAEEFNSFSIDIFAYFMILKTAVTNLDLGFIEEMKDLTDLFQEEEMRKLYKFLLYDLELSIMMYSSLQTNTFLHFFKDVVNDKVKANSKIPKLNYIHFSIDKVNLAAIQKVLRFEYNSKNNLNSAKELPEISYNSSMLIEVWKVVSDSSTADKYKFGIRMDYAEDYEFVVESAELVPILQNVMISPDFNNSEKDFYCGVPN